MTYQYMDLNQNPAQAGQELTMQVTATAQKMAKNFKTLVEMAPDDQKLQVITALRELAKISDEATWATRMLVELSGRHKIKRGMGNVPSQREMAAASGLSLATIHEWIHHPAQPVDGQSGPGTLPRPGQTRHRFSALPTETAETADPDPWGSGQF